MKNRVLILAVLNLVFSFLVSGCDTGKGKEFIGDWKQIDNKYPSYVHVYYDDGVFHIDKKYMDESVAENKFNEQTKDYFDGKIKDMPTIDSVHDLDSYRTKKMEAVALSNTVLKGDGFSMRLENGKLTNGNEVYVKVKR